MTVRENQIVDLLKAIETKDEAAMGIISPQRYIQHNLHVADDIGGFKELVQSLPDGLAKVSIKRAFQDGDYVFAHSEIDIGGAKAVFDIFRFEGDYIVEHWDCGQLLEPENPSLRTMLDGATEAIDLEKTEQNKLVAKAFVEKVLKAGNLDIAANYVHSDGYLQHHPLIADGLDALVFAFQSWVEAGVVVQYDRIHHVLGKGNFVLVSSEGIFNGEPTAFYDMFRIKEGKVAEHWDVVEAIPAKSEWANSNGKF